MKDHPYNPTYPKLSKEVEYWRARAKAALLSPTEKRAYGDAVHRAILALQRTEANAYLNHVKGPRPRCASGTWHNDGDMIHASVREQLKRAFAAAVKRDGARRAPWQWEDDYAKAMREKAARLAQSGFSVFDRAMHSHR
jgi:hypothetical protein